MTNLRHRLSKLINLITKQKLQQGCKMDKNKIQRFLAVHHWLVGEMAQPWVAASFS
jgi:hypothetical protein